MLDILTLLDELTSGDDTLAEQAALKLAGHPEACLPYLQNLIQSGSDDQRWWAVRTLAEMRPGNNIPGMLVAALQDPSPQVRQCAALGLQNHPHPEAIPALLAAVQAGDPMLSSLAASAMIKVGPEAVPALLDTFENVPPAARIEILRVFAEIGDHRSIPVLMKAMQSDSAVSQYWAEQGLNKMGLGMVYIKPA